jgi:cyclic pyranopterin phosphate synthase
VTTATLQPAEPWWATSFMVTFAFQCNLACRFCMVEDALGHLDGTTLDAFRGFAEGGDAATRLRGRSRIIFSGGEVTLDRKLHQYVEYARRLPGIEHVRLQTNATRLADPALLDSLVSAGVDEFFVSLHAASARVYDPLVQRDGAFAQIRAGLDALAARGLAVWTNTAIVADNVDELPAVAALALEYRPRGIEFWNYWPRGDEDAHRAASSPVARTLPRLREALTRVTAAGIAPVIKWFPRCLLGEWAVYQDDGQPPALIDEGYWDREPEYNCLFGGVCTEYGARCNGLSDTYVQEHGWEENLLVPIRRPGEIAARRDHGDPVRSLVEDAGPARAERALLLQWLARFELALGTELAGWRLLSTTKGRVSGGAELVAIDFGRGSDRVAVRIGARDDARKCFARTASFDAFHTRVPAALERDAYGLMQALVERINTIDRGGERLP